MGQVAHHRTSTHGFKHPGRCKWVVFFLNLLRESLSVGRCFVRPSGTEDVVRVYAEAETREQALSLAHEAAALVSEMVS